MDERNATLFIQRVSEYALQQHNPQITRELMQIIYYVVITTPLTVTDIIDYIKNGDFSSEVKLFTLVEVLTFL